VTLFQNPVFLTQRRLAHRAGLPVPLLVAGVIGLALLAGLLYQAAGTGAPPRSRQDTGRLLYGWLLAAQALLLIAGGYGRVSRVMADERAAGLWDSNRLTPLQPSQLVSGYWFGAALRQFYMSLVLAAAGLLLVAAAGLPLSLWMGTQLLVFTTALLFGLVAVAAGMVFQRASGGMVLLSAFILIQAFSLFRPQFMLINFLLPVYPAVHLFSAGTAWNASPECFGLRLDPVLYSLGLQLAAGVFLWRAVVRKAADPLQSLLRRREAVALFGVIVLAQHGLIWSLWQGRFGLATPTGGEESMLSVAQGITLALGAIALLAAEPPLERVRLEVLRAGVDPSRNHEPRGALSLPLVLAAVASAALITHCAGSVPTAWRACLVASVNLAAFFTVFSLWLEFCRLRFRHHGAAFLALGLSAVCLLPFALAALFSYPPLGRVSLLAPGILALRDPVPAAANSLLLIDAVHFVLAAALFCLWRRCWRQWRQRKPD
jgi:hypothetical protein